MSQLSCENWFSSDFILYQTANNEILFTIIMASYGN